ncbi:MAG: hypothetical protein LUD51_08025 [Clostridia bacterium]|nr:hypothetical protein [Clostridia bacterium]
MDEGHRIRGLRFAGGYSMRLSGYSSAYHSGDISGRQTVGDIANEGQEIACKFPKQLFGFMDLLRF